MSKINIMVITLLYVLTSGYLYASFHAEYSPCSGVQGKVVEVTDNEVFAIAVCDQVKVFKEFSYCYDVEPGDMVFFDDNPDRCEMTGFTVLRNGVQCGVICPEPDQSVKVDTQ